MRKLVRTVQRLEVSLYRNAHSFDAYMDTTTLLRRLQQIVVESERDLRRPQ